MKKICSTRAKQRTIGIAIVCIMMGFAVIGCAQNIEDSGVTAINMDAIFMDKMMEWMSSEEVTYLKVGNENQNGWSAQVFFIPDDGNDTLLHSAIWSEEVEQLTASTEYSADLFMQEAFLNCWFNNMYSITQTIGNDLGTGMVDLDGYIDLLMSGGGAFKCLQEEYISGTIHGVGEWEIMPVQILDSAGKPQKEETYLLYRKTLFHQNDNDELMIWLVTDPEQVNYLYTQMKESIRLYSNFHVEM